MSSCPFFDSNDYPEDLSSFAVKPGQVVLAMSGATTGKVGFYKEQCEAFLNQRVGLFRPNQGFLFDRFLFFYLMCQQEHLYAIAGGGAQPNLSSEKLKKISIPVPPLEEQERIVAILDKFDALVNDISQGIPAEIEARRKQYAYYRDKLLNFQEKKTS